MLNTINPTYNADTIRFSQELSEEFPYTPGAEALVTSFLKESKLAIT